jgi:hypothetical protein
MSNGFASALEISARIVRKHLDDHTTARRLITEWLLGTQARMNEDPVWSK